MYQRSKNIQAGPTRERRQTKDRRQNKDRRASSERRHDSREGRVRKKRSLKDWIRMLTNARLGVDRRKKERRAHIDRRRKDTLSILTQDEISDLLSS